jgi:hypothetical protein
MVTGVPAGTLGRGRSPPDWRSDVSAETFQVKRSGTADLQTKKPASAGLVLSPGGKAGSLDLLKWPEWRKWQTRRSQDSSVYVTWCPTSEGIPAQNKVFFASCDGPP